MNTRMARSWLHLLGSPTPHLWIIGKPPATLSTSGRGTLGAVLPELLINAARWQRFVDKTTMGVPSLPCPSIHLTRG